MWWVGVTCSGITSRSTPFSVATSYAFLPNRDNPDGLFWYGLCLCEGRGTHPDPTTGKQLIARAAAEGNYDAREWLDEQQATAE